ncbi:MAG: hypothetical protein RLZZ516_1779, partial [Cyanobacteriota bacterium]
PERRYVRDDGPLDVDPLPEERGGGRRSDPGDDPW